MAQLIIQGITMPVVTENNYKCYMEDSNENLRMVNGRMVTEVGYSVRVIEYTLGGEQYLSDNTRRALMDILRSGNPIDVLFSSPESDEMERDMFFCTAIPRPSVAYVSGGQTFWKLQTIKLEEVEPYA